MTKIMETLSLQLDPDRARMVEFGLDGTGSEGCLGRFATREVRMQREKIVGKPWAENPHLRFAKEPQDTGRNSTGRYGA